MKLVVTHIKPHLDDIAAAWLIKKFYPGFDNAVLKFLPLEPSGGKTYDGRPVDSNPNIIHVGMARGMFDEHRGVQNASAATLVFDFLKKKGYLPADIISRRALGILIQYILEEDTGRLKGEYRYNLFMPPALLATISNSLSRSRFGFMLLERMRLSAEMFARLERDFKSGFKFKTRWGEAMALRTTMPGADAFAYGQGYTLVVQKNPVTRYCSVRASAKSAVSLKPVYERLKKIEPAADWYLHHSGKLLICGDSVAPKGTMSRLTLQELTELLKR